MLDEGGILTALDAHPDACMPVRWGKLAAGLLEEAWEAKGGRR